MSSLRILHQAWLRHGAWGGMERSFAQFLAATHQDPDLHNYVVENLHDAADPMLRALHALHAPAVEIRRWGGVPLPPRPRGLRELHRYTLARRWRINRVLNWNGFGDVQPARTARRLGAASVYWERGAAWFDRARPDAGFESAYDLYLANSEASRQMLQQRWNVLGDIRVCTPGLPSCTDSTPRSLPRNRPLRIGFAARLRGFKGGVLALHTLRELLDRRVDAELWIAGEGPDRMRMERLGARLNLSGRLRFLGWVSSPDTMFRSIDVLLHPALREPYGLACAEALCRGVPVVASCVDGLPEVIEQGQTGICVVPELPLASFGAFGGDVGDVYPLVYRPERGHIDTPGVTDPAALAAAVIDITSDAHRYAAFSASAVAAAGLRFSYPAHLRRLRGLLEGVASEDRAVAEHSAVSLGAAPP